MRVGLSLFCTICLLSLPVSSGTANESITIAPQLGHYLTVNSVAFSPDGRLVLSGSSDKTLKLWDVASRRLLRNFWGHAKSVASVAFSPDGKAALSASEDKTVKLWELASGRVLGIFKGHSGAVRSVAFSPDGKIALSGSDDKTLKLWETASGREIRTFEGHTKQVTSVGFSPDGKTALSGSWDSTIKLWDVSSGRELKTFEVEKNLVDSIAFSPDGKTALSASWSLKLWDVAKGDDLMRFVPTEGISSAAFSPDGKNAISGGNDGVKLWDVATGRALRTFLSGMSSVESLAFSPDGKTAIAAGHGVKLWDVATGREIGSFDDYTSKVRTVAFSPDGETALSAGDDIKLWDVASGRLIRSFQGHELGTAAIAFSPDGKTALSGSYDRTIRLWDIESGSEIRRFAGRGNAVTSVAFSPDGKTALSGSWDRTIRLWDIESGQELKRFGGDFSAFSSVAFSPDGQTALAGNWDSNVILWDLAAGGRKFRAFSGHDGAVTSIAFAPDGTSALSGGIDATVRLWDVVSGRELRRFAGHADQVLSVVFSPDGKTALSGSMDNSIKLWEVASGRLLKSFAGHTDQVEAVAFSPNGKMVVSGSQDGTTRLWDIERGEELAALTTSRSSGAWLALTNRGFFAASDKGVDGLLSVVRGTEVYSVLQFYEHLHRPDLVAERLKGDREGKYTSAANVLNLESILESGPAPKIERLPDRERLERGTAELAVRLTDLGGGIGERVIWRVNGVAQGATTATGLGGATRPGRYVVMEQTLHFDPSQETKIEVIGYNGKGLLATPPLQFSIDPIFGVVDKPKPHLFVLAVGINEYLKADLQLTNSVNDVDALSEAFKTVGSAFFGEGNVEVKTIRNKEATAHGIGAALREFADKVQPQDVFVLHLSGHGRAIAGNGPGTGWFFLPQDLDLSKHTVAENAISAATLEGWLRDINALKSLVVLDACESGAYEAHRGESLVTESQIAQFSYATGRSTIAAAPAGKAAYEGYKGHGILTYTVLEAMNRPEGMPEQPIDLIGLASHVSVRVIEISKAEFGITQIPKTNLKDNFVFGISQPVMTAAAVSCKVPDTLERPSHYVSRNIEVRIKPSEDSDASMVLARKTLVTVTGCEGDWALIIRDGKSGYVSYRVLEEVY